MISARIHNIARAEAETYAPTAERDGFDAVSLIPVGRNSLEAVTLFLPFGTGAAVAACINVAVSSGAREAKAHEIAKLTAKWNGICEAMNVGRWHGSEADALDQIESIKAQIARLEAAE